MLRGRGASTWGLICTEYSLRCPAFKFQCGDPIPAIVLNRVSIYTIILGERYMPPSYTLMESKINLFRGVVNNCRKGRPKAAQDIKRDHVECGGLGTWIETSRYYLNGPWTTKTTNAKHYLRIPTPHHMMLFELIAHNRRHAKQKIGTSHNAQWYKGIFSGRGDSGAL